MWDLLRVRERERRLGILFVSVVATVFVASAVGVRLPLEWQAVGVSLVGVIWVLAVRRAVGVREGRYGSAPVGPLSPDERAKARSKLLGARGPGLAGR